MDDSSSRVEIAAESEDLIIILVGLHGGGFVLEFLEILIRKKSHDDIPKAAKMVASYLLWVDGGWWITSMIDQDHATQYCPLIMFVGNLLECVR